MKISELILELENIKEKEGDLVVESTMQSCCNCYRTDRLNIEVEDNILIVEGL